MNVLNSRSFDFAKSRAKCHIQLYRQIKNDKMSVVSLGSTIFPLKKINLSSMKSY